MTTRDGRMLSVSRVAGIISDDLSHGHFESQDQYEAEAEGGFAIFVNVARFEDGRFTRSANGRWIKVAITEASAAEAAEAQAALDRREAVYKAELARQREERRQARQGARSTGHG